MEISAKTGDQVNELFERVAFMLHFKEDSVVDMGRKSSFNLTIKFNQGPKRKKIGKGIIHVAITFSVLIKQLDRL